MLLCEAAGYDVILIETVGVGQSEYQVAAMVDFFLVLMLPNAGDELQGIKRGIMELADALVINKHDGQNTHLAEKTKGHYQNALHLMQQNKTWTPQVKTCSAIENTGIQAVWDMILEYKDSCQTSGEFLSKRAKQKSEWFESLIQEMLTLKLKHNKAIQTQLPQLQQDVLQNHITPYHAAQKILALF